VELDKRGLHARTCKTGGAVVRRHDRIRDWLAAWVEEVTNRTALTEQFVPKWDRQDKKGQMIRAKLDVCFDDAQGRRVYVDVAVTDAATTCAQALRARAKRDGAAASEEEDEKRGRYPGPDLTPFVVEALGRLGDSADAFLRSLAPRDPEERSRVLRAARQTLSVLVQIGNAELLLSAMD